MFTIFELFLAPTGLDFASSALSVPLASSFFDDFLELTRDFLDAFLLPFKAFAGDFSTLDVSLGLDSGLGIAVSSGFSTLTGATSIGFSIITSLACFLTSSSLIWSSFNFSAASSSCSKYF
jgi:hypothetical protein